MEVRSFAICLNDNGGYFEIGSGILRKVSCILLDLYLLTKVCGRYTSSKLRGSVDRSLTIGPDIPSYSYAQSTWEQTAKQNDSSPVFQTIEIRFKYQCRLYLNYICRKAGPGDSSHQEVCMFERRRLLRARVLLDWAVAARGKPTWTLDDIGMTRDGGVIDRIVSIGAYVKFRERVIVHFAVSCRPSHQPQPSRSSRHVPSSPIDVWDPRPQARLLSLFKWSKYSSYVQPSLSPWLEVRSSASQQPPRCDLYSVDRF